ncbi:hypothetical protein Leryth_001031 [Lithospermum erythrorhizon]|nr:hypothetical protein Leryth_001031 [Lithospermum erythrorhizon]
MVPSSLGSLLHHCSKTKAFHKGLTLHASAIKTALSQDIYISNHILNLYAKCGKLNYARHVFDEMSHRNVVTWSAMISGYDQAGQFRNALILYSRLRADCNIWPNEFVFASVLSSCACLMWLPVGQQVHCEAVKLNYSSVSFVENSLISMYMKCGKWDDAVFAFENVDCPTLVSYNAIINGLVENEEQDKGIEVFRNMCWKGLVPDQFSFVGLLGSCLTLDDLRKGMVLHCFTIKLNLESLTFIGNVLVTMYAKLYMLDEVEKVFISIKEKDVISWNSRITACCNCNNHVKALNVVRDMVRVDCVKLDYFTYASILSACAGVASRRLGMEIHANLIRRFPDRDVCIENALINMYAKCGCIWHAYAVFNNMQDQNLVSWNSIISGFANHGFGGKAIELFEQMKGKGLKPDSVTFLELLTACNHAGLVDEGKEYFHLMTLYGSIPDIEHFSCLLDMLGRAGRLNEAEDLMQKYSVEDDHIILGCLLSASRLHGDVDVGERLASRLLKLQPVSTSPYVLLSNLFASDEMWDNVGEARKMLKVSGLKKEPGHSLIEVKGSVERFIVGDFSHSRIKEMVATLKILSWKEVDEVLFN